MTIDKQRIPSLRDVDKAIARWMYPDATQIIHYGETIIVELPDEAYSISVDPYTQSLDAQVPVLEKLEREGLWEKVINILREKYIANCIQLPDPDDTEVTADLSDFWEFLNAPPEVRARAVAEVLDDVRK